LLKIQKKDDNRRGLVHLIKGNSHLIAGKKVIAKLDIIIGKKKKKKELEISIRKGTRTQPQGLVPDKKQDVATNGRCCIH
jgi:hypothetical protein